MGETGFCYLCAKPMGMYAIRQATTTDIPLIRRMAAVTFPATYAPLLTPEQVAFMMEWMYSPESLRRQLTAERHVYFVAEASDGPAGYVSVQPEGNDLYHLQKLYVLPARQGTGLGALLFRHAVAYIRRVHPGPCRMELNVNRQNPAVGFYERMGMRRLREGDFPIGNGYYMNDYIMGLDL